MCTCIYFSLSGVHKEDYFFRGAQIILFDKKSDSLQYDGRLRWLASAANAKLTRTMVPPFSFPLNPTPSRLSHWVQTNPTSLCHDWPADHEHEPLAIHSAEGGIVSTNQRTVNQICREMAEENNATPFFSRSLSRPAVYLKLYAFFNIIHFKKV